MCGHFFDHGIGSVIAKALPIAAAFIPGVGPLASAALTAGAGAIGSKLQGSDWGSALTSGALSGLAAGAAPILGNAFSSIAPETAGALGINGGYDTVFGQGFGGGAGGALNGAAPTGMEQISGALSSADPSLSATGVAYNPNAVGAMGAPNGSIVGPTQGLNSGTENFLSNLGGGTTSGTGNNSASGLLSGALSKVGQNPLGAATALLSLTSALGGNKINGEQTQQQILDAQKAKAAQDAAFSQQTVNALNSASLGRSPVNPNISDYYTYGTRPEATFFSQANPIHYGS